MGTPRIDVRDRGELLWAREARARAYTPEWRFDREDPDLGAALAMIYSELFAGTVTRFNQVPAKNMVEFYNRMGLELKPAMSAQGYVHFGLAGPVEEGAAVKAGTPLLASAGTETGSVVFETTDDVHVTPARVEKIFTVCGGADAIVRSYDAQQGDREFYLFDWKENNLQGHELRLSQEEILNISPGGVLEVDLIPGHQRELPQAAAQVLEKPAQAVWEYTSGETWQRFDTWHREGNRFLLALGREQMPVTPTQGEQEEPRRWVRLRLKEGTLLPPLTLGAITLAARNTELLPDGVHASGTDQNIHSFYPFGEQLGLFAEVYLGCEEALTKRGAQVELRFRLDFVVIPLEYDTGASQTDWKLVMKKSRFRQEEEFDIAIQEVVWEYFNGNGWARLFPDDREADCFNGIKGDPGREKILRFRCPEDIQPVLVNSGVGYYIRARVLKIKNLYRLKGQYIVPRMEDARFSYRYDQGGRVPQILRTRNNREETVLEGSRLLGRGPGFQPFRFLEEQNAALYFGFDRSPTGGPVKMLILLAEALGEKPEALRWQQRTSRGWEMLNVVDGTQSLRQSGILTLMAGENMERSRLWGEELYWIRAVDVRGRYSGQQGAVQLPRVAGLYMNATGVKNLDTRPPERFFVEPEQRAMQCPLRENNVQWARVWVNEAERLPPEQQQMLERAGRLREVRDPAGTLREAWVLWEEQEDLALSGPEDRHYVLDRNEGVLRFPDGVNGKLPPAGKQETIEVEYATGGGAWGNVPPGAIDRSAKALGVVNRIENPRPTAGGCDQENFHQAIARGGAALRHGGRAVTARDFEALALEATRNILRAKCFSGRDDTGRRSPGRVTVVALLRDYENTTELMGTVRSQVMDHITRRCGGNLAALDHFQVVAPQFLELCVKTELTVGDLNQVFAVREKIQHRLAQFLDPLTGNFDGKGWEVGTIPNDTQLRNCLNSIPGIRFLKQVSATAFLETGFGRTEVDLDTLGERPYVLPRSGTHTVVITVE